MSGDVVEIEAEVEENVSPRVKVWVGALVSLCALYVPLTPLILDTIANGRLHLYFLPGLPVFAPVYLSSYYLNVGVPFGMRGFILLTYVLTLIWLVGLFGLSFKGRRIFWRAAVISAVVSGLLGTGIYVDWF